MRAFIAKKASLDTMRECQGKGCNCFTNHGYYIQYRNSNVDSILFVCDGCYEMQFKDRCILGSFDENKYQHFTSKERYYCGNPSLLKFTRRFRKGVLSARISLIILSCLLIIGLCIVEKPHLRNEYPQHQIHLEINSENRGFENVLVVFHNINNKINDVIKHNGGNNND